MSKFADELFADLMREHGPALEILDRPLPPEASRRLITVRPRPSRPPAGHPRRPRRQPAWLAPVAAATGVTLAVGLAVVLGRHVDSGGHTGPANDGRAQTAYVFNAYQGTVAPISPATGKLGTPVRVGPKGYLSGTRKRRIQDPRVIQDLVLPDGTTDYALYSSGRGNDATEALRRTSLVTGAAGRPIQLGRGVQQMVITPDGTTAYVTYRLGRYRTEYALRPVSLVTGTVGKPILRANEAGPVTAVAPSMTPDGRTLYVPYWHQHKVIPISTATNTPGKPIRLPSTLSVEFSPDGQTAFVIGAGMVTPISTATNTPGRTISLGPHADLAAFTPDGRTVYVINYAGSVTPISFSSGGAGKPIPLHGIDGVADTAVTPDGRAMYVTSFKGNRVIPISLATNTAAKPLNVPGTVLNIVLTPDGRTAYTYSGMAGEAQIVTPISTATNTVGKPIRTAPDTEVLIPGDQNPQ